MIHSFRRNEYLCFQKITKLEYDIPEGFPDNATDLVTRLLVRCHVIVTRRESHVHYVLCSLLLLVHVDVKSRSTIVIQWLH